MEVDVGEATTCVRLRTGDVRCFGDNQYGQIGDGTRIQRSTPVALSGLP
jgi:hypothetical protein